MIIIRIRVTTSPKIYIIINAADYDFCVIIFSLFSASLFKAGTCSPGQNKIACRCRIYANR